tara:strand:- start:160 stop:360 length:201 start_codon:yes stop_codon:yes gene_type:complete
MIRNKEKRMPSLSKIQNRLHKIKVEIMNLEESIKTAEAAGKPHFANRLRMMIKKKLENINSLVAED